MTGLTMLILSSMASMALSDLRFRPEAGRLIRLEHTQGVRGPRYTEMSVSYRPQSLLEGDLGQVRQLGARLWLEMRRDGGCWTKVSGDPIQRGSHRLLHRIEIYPCQSHEVRLALQNDDCVSYLASDKLLAAVSPQVLHSSGYRPHTPHSLEVRLMDNVPLVSWQPVRCTSSYELWYGSLDSGETDSGNLTLSPGMTEDVALYGLRQECSDYSLRLVAVTGEEFSNEVDVVFNTCDNTTQTQDGDVTLDYPLETEDICVTSFTECVSPKPRQARDLVSGRADGPMVMSLIHLCAVLIIAKML